MSKKTSILDIAKAVGASPTAVSFVLNGLAKEKRISEKLEGQILDYVNKIGYKPNPLARSLRTGKTNTIGLVVESISNPFFANIARAIEDMAYANGYRILYSSTENKVERTREVLRLFADRQVDGYIISPPEGVDKEIRQLIDAKRPVVLFDRTIAHLDLDSVGIDNEFSAYNATKVLINNAYQCIACVTLDSLQPQMRDRETGYRKALADEGRQPLFFRVAYDAEDSFFFPAFSLFLEQHKQVDAVLFTTNYLAVKGLKCIRKHGLEIGAKLGFIAFDDHDLFELYHPPITAIAQPIKAIAEKLIALLLHRLGNDEKSPPPQHLTLQTELLLRGSSGKQK